MNVPIIDQGAVNRILNMRVCIDLIKQVQIGISEGAIKNPLRSFNALSQKQNLFGVMPGELPKQSVFGAKLISVYPENPKINKQPAIQGFVLLFDSDTGAPLAFVDAASLTAIRTAAASAAATHALARDNAKVLALLGYGVQAASHLQAMLEVREIDKVYVWGPTLANALAFAEKYSRLFEIEIQAVDQAEYAVRHADILCAVSNASQAIIKGNWLQKGAHINLVGAHTPDTREADTLTMSRSRIFTEISEIALKESGDLILPLASGDISISDIVSEIGLVYKGVIKGRLNSTDITLYKSLGNTAQDLICADYVFRNYKAA